MLVTALMRNLKLVEFSQKSPSQALAKYPARKRHAIYIYIHIRMFASSGATKASPNRMAQQYRRRLDATI